MTDTAHGERLLLGLGEIREDIVQEAAEAAAEEAEGRKRKNPWRKYAAMAACLALVVFAVNVLNGNIPLLGGNASGQGLSGALGEERTFGFYTGPVLPLSLAEPNDAITAQREVTLDFSPWMPVWKTIEEIMAERTFTDEEDRQRTLQWLQEDCPAGGRYETRDTVLVRDETVLTNTSAADQTVTILYPFVGRFSQLEEQTPKLTADGEPLDTHLWAGRLTDTTVTEDADTGSRVVPGVETGVYHGTSFAQYRDILGDGTYQASALEPAAAFSGTCVWYTFSLPETAAEGTELEVRFSLDYDATRVFRTEGNYGKWDSDGGTMMVGGHVYEEFSFLVLGEDIRDLEVQCVRNQDGTMTPVEGEVVQERREADVAETLHALAEEMYQQLNTDCSFQLWYQLFLDSLEVCFQADAGFLPEMVHFADMDRVFYCIADITVPAGGSAVITATSEKAGSYDFSCTGKAAEGVETYQLATRLGSALTFQSQKAFLEDRGQIEIVRQNFGFDIRKGIRESLLTEDCYWLAVRRLPGSIPEEPET